ncbi:MAG: AraC family transcriptional regulator [Bacteroidaceae bacterium]|nr:AraC family transcriptional regulator [Bacteroidaceae bacterium]
MRRLSKFIYLIILLLMTGCTAIGNTEETANDGSYHAGFAQTMGMADSLYNSMQFRDAYKLYLQLLDSKEVQADSEKRLNVLNCLCNTSELSGHKVDQHKWLQQLRDLAEQTGNNYYLSLAYITMGQNLFYEGDREKGIHCMNEGIDLMVKIDHDNTDHLIHGYLNMLASMYGAMKDYDNALQTNERNLQLTMEGTRWGTAPNQQLIDRRMALAKMAALQAKMGDFQRADSAYAAWKAVQYEGNHTRDYFIVDYMKRRGRYQEAVTIYNNLILRIRQQGDTLGEMMNTAKWGLAEVYRKMGNCEQAAILYEQVLEIQDTLKTRKARNSAQELAAVYHEKEQEQIIMRQEAENTRNRYLLFSVLAVLVGVTVLAVIILHKNRIISSKNHYLSQQINEALSYKKKILECEQSNTIPAGNSSLSTPDSSLNSAVAPDDLNALTDEQLFRHIHEIIVRDRLYLDPSFERQTIMDRFQLSKERVGAVFTKCSGHAKISGYILQLRLDYAAQILVDNPECTITQVATDCGFGGSAYFSSCFRQHFGISPTEFRRNTAALSED